MSLCVAAGGTLKLLQVAAFTLAWTHSVEKTTWEEDWAVTAQGLRLVAARIKGSGAGMDPPPDARRVNGWWQWHPERPVMTKVLLANSGAAGEWRLCAQGTCRTLAEILGVAAAPTVELTSCDAGRRPATKD